MKEIGAIPLTFGMNAVALYLAIDFGSGPPGNRDVNTDSFIVKLLDLMRMTGLAGMTELAG